MIKNTLNVFSLCLLVLCATSSVSDLHANPTSQETYSSKKCTDNTSCSVVNKLKCFIKNVYPYVGLAAYCLWAKPYLKNEKNFKMFCSDEYNAATKEFINSIAKTILVVCLCKKIEEHVKYLDAKAIETSGLNEADCAA